jgi:hypothetical protein
MYLLRLLPVASLAFVSTACDLIESAKSTIVVAGVLAATPELKLDGQFDVESETLATAYIAERASATSSEEPTPINGADVKIEFAGRTIALPEEDMQRGLYAMDSLRDMDLSFNEGQVYNFAVEIPGNDAGPFGGRVTAPTRLSPASLTLTPEPQPVPMVPNLYSHPKNADFTIGWTEQNGRYAYVTVFRADASNPDEPQLVYDSRPETAEEMIRFIIGTPPTSLTVPGATFDRDGGYAVVIVTADKGMVDSNTFVGSPILAGSGEKVLLAIGDFRP